MQDSPEMNLACSFVKSYPGEEGGGREDLTAFCSHMKGGWSQVGLGLFQVKRSKTRGKGLMLHQERFKLGSRKIFFTESNVKRWNRLPREVVKSLSLEVLKTDVDGLGRHKDGT